MKHPRDEEAAPEVSLALSLTTTADSSSSTSTTTVSSGSASPPPPAAKRRRRRGPVVATSGEGDFVCKTCGRAFTSFQALGGHRTSHLRGRARGLDLGVVGAKALKQHKVDSSSAAAADKKKPTEEEARRRQQHACHICGLGFEMGQALGGHMRRHREEADADDWVWRTQEIRPDGDYPPVLLQLFA